MILSCLFAAKRRTNNAVTSHSSQAKLHFLVWFVGKLLPGENIRMPENIEKNVGQGSYRLVNMKFKIF